MAIVVTVVAAVCVNFRSATHVARLLDSIATFPISEVLILDNFSDNEEAARLRSIAATNPLVKLYFSCENVGFGAGVNRLVSALTPGTDYVWVLNPDITAEPGALHSLIESARQNDCDIISPLVLSQDGERIWYAGGKLDFLGGRSVHVGIGTPVQRRPAGFHAVSFVTGAAPLISLSAWSRLGGFDEALFLYCEDADLSIRATGLDLVMGIDCDAVVRHAEGGSSGGSSRGQSAVFYYFVQRNRLRVYSSGRTKLSVLVGRGILETARLTILPWRPLDREAPRRFLWSLRGIVAGLRGEQGPGPLAGRPR